LANTLKAAGPAAAHPQPNKAGFAGLKVNIPLPAMLELALHPETGVYRFQEKFMGFRRRQIPARFAQVPCAKSRSVTIKSLANNWPMTGTLRV
jgi:hypothetical protein